MAKFNKDHKPTGDAAKDATKTDLPDGFVIRNSIRRGRTSYGPGKEEAYRDTKPSKADVKRHVDSGAIVLPAEKAESGK